MKFKTYKQMEFRSHTRNKKDRAIKLATDLTELDQLSGVEFESFFDLEFPVMHDEEFFAFHDFMQGYR